MFLVRMGFLSNTCAFPTTASKNEMEKTYLAINCPSCNNVIKNSKISNEIKFYSISWKSNIILRQKCLKKLNL